MLLVLEIEKINPQIFIDMEENKEVTVSGKGVSIYFKDDYIKELEEKAKKYDEHIENQEIIKKEYERLEKEAEPLREKAKEARQKSLELINHLDKMISEAKKTPESNQKKEFKSNEEFSNDLEVGYLGTNVKPRTNF